MQASASLHDPVAFLTAGLVAAWLKQQSIPASFLQTPSMVLCLSHAHTRGCFCSNHPISAGQASRGFIQHGAIADVGTRKGLGVTFSRVCPHQSLRRVVSTAPYLLRENPFELLSPGNMSRTTVTPGSLLWYSEPHQLPARPHPVFSVFSVTCM